MAVRAGGGNILTFNILPHITDNNWTWINTNTQNQIKKKQWNKLNRI